MAVIQEINVVKKHFFFEGYRVKSREQFQTIIYYEMAYYYVYEFDRYFCLFDRCFYFRCTVITKECLQQYILSGPSVFQEATSNFY